MALVGTLSDFNLVDLLQLISLGKKSGTLVLHGQRNADLLEGDIYFAEGLIQGARRGSLRGEAALYEFFLASEGSFEFLEGNDIPPADLHLSTEAAIMEGIGRQEDWARVETHLPPDDASVALCPIPRSPLHTITLEADKWRVVAVVNGSSTVGQIIERSGLGRYRATQMIVELLDVGLAESKGEE